METYVIATKADAVRLFGPFTFKETAYKVADEIRVHTGYSAAVIVSIGQVDAAMDFINMRLAETDGKAIR